MQWRQPAEPQFQRTRLPRLVAPWLHLIHTEPGGQLLPSERDEADLDRQQRQGEGVPRPGGQGEAEVLLHLIHTEPGRQILPSERDEADLDRQQRQGEGVPRPGGQGEAEVLLDRRQREREEHQVAKRPEVQQRQMVQHWRCWASTA